MTLLVVKSHMAVKSLVNKITLSMLIAMSLQWVTPSIAGTNKKKVISFSRAKTLLAAKVYGKAAKTFYCGCKYQKKSIKSKSCKLLTKKFKKRMSRLEWEHIVPAHAFGQSFIEWRDHKKICKKSKSPRKCARKKNILFKEMEGNLINLVPSIGAVNALRSNFSFSNIEESKFELCRGGLKLQGRKVSPPKNRKGDIARIYFYMNKKYPNRGIISNKNIKLFKLWNSIDPVDTEECRIDLIKSKIQKDYNHFVQDFCKDIK